MQMQELLNCAQDWALLNGAVMRSRIKPTSDSVIFVPFTFLPSPFPKDQFQFVLELQTTLNELTHKVAYDHEFLTTTLKNTIEVDPFTKHLFDIYEIIHKEGTAQPYSLGLFRSDYMLHMDENNDEMRILQVEMNTIASSMAGLAMKFDALHKFILERLNRLKDIPKLPENNALNGLCSGLVVGWKYYNEGTDLDSTSYAAVLIVIENTPNNVGDQRAYEFEIYKLNPHIKVIRCTLTELFECGRLDEKKKYFVNHQEIAVVYFRSGYSPDQYPTENEWNVRLDIERSRAIKCPSINYHLAGTKKIQQELAFGDTLSRFLSDRDKIEDVKKVFAGLYSMDLDSHGDLAVEKALKNPENFVLKPQREGGGNNIYGSNIASFLNKILKSKERSAYILMDRIHPPINTNYIIRAEVNDDEEKMKQLNVISELGVYGVIIGCKNEIKLNQQVGHMMRTKNCTADEGGVVAGIGALDTPLLY